MKNVLIIDVETTGIDPETANICEVGAILYSVDHRCTLAEISWLTPVEENPQQHRNGITPAATQLLPSMQSQAWTFLADMACYAQAFCAHRAEFDRRFVDVYAAQVARALPWIDTLPIEWPSAMRRNPSLIALAVDYGVPVTGAHRALTDCRLLASVFDREPELEGLLKTALEPKRWLIAPMRYEQTELREQAKQLGFRWKDDKCPAQSCWSIQLPESIALAAAALGHYQSLPIKLIEA